MQDCRDLQWSAFRRLVALLLDCDSDADAAALVAQRLQLQLSVAPPWPGRTALVSL